MENAIADAATNLAAATRDTVARQQHLVISVVEQPALSIRPGSLADGTVRVARAACVRSSAAVARNPRTAIAIAAVGVVGAGFANRRKIGRFAAYCVALAYAPVSNVLDSARQAIHEATAPSGVVTEMAAPYLGAEYDEPAVFRRAPFAGEPLRNGAMAHA